MPVTPGSDRTTLLRHLVASAAGVRRPGYLR